MNINTSEVLVTFKELYSFLQSYENTNIITWLKEPWVGKDKQESVLRLFAGLKCIDELDPYTMCKGNFNNKTIEKMENYEDIFYDAKNNLIKLKDKGDKSDLTMMFNKNDKKIVVSSSKNRADKKRRNRNI